MAGHVHDTNGTTTNRGVTSMVECEGCHDTGGNWDCGGEGEPDCECENCTGNPNCPECGGYDDED